MKVLDEHPQRTDILWPGSAAWRAGRWLGLALLAGGVAALALDFAGVMPPLQAVDPAFFACAAIVAGIILVAYAAGRGAQRRLRIDRAAGTVAMARLKSGDTWRVERTAALADVGEVIIDSHESDDSPTLHQVLLKLAGDGRFDAAPLFMRDRAEAERLAAALRAGLGRP
jgi:hypothetical protein